MTIRHVLSDKTGTLTENNLQVVRIQSLTKEITISNEFFSQGTVHIDKETNLLLLNMTTNHSALSIPNHYSNESLQHTDSISFSDIVVISNEDEYYEQQELLCHQSKNHDLISQIFCSSQDERVFIQFDFF